MGDTADGVDRDESEVQSWQIAAACIAQDGEWAGPSGNIDAVATVLIIGASRGIGLPENAVYSNMVRVPLAREEAHEKA